MTKPKRIDTLILDIYALLGDSNKDLVFNTAEVEKLGFRMAQHVMDEIKDPDRSDRAPTNVYVTQLTSNCPRRRWYSRNAEKHGIKSEKIRGENRFKFLYGDLIEESVLFLAELAGHKVERRQERLTKEYTSGMDTYTLVGRIDAIIDGVLVDVKSMESFTYDKFERGEYDDKWGYGNQLYVYDEMLGEGVVSDRMILGINKLNGKMHLSRLEKDSSFKLKVAIEDATASDKNKVMADRQVINKSGMDCLGTMCAYCPFKVDCYKNEGGLRVYAYSEGPRFVVGTPAKEPKVPEVTTAWLKETHG